MIRLLLVRHGVTEWNQAGRYQGHQDVPLSDLGRAQARRLGERLAGEAISEAYSSDLARARETAELVLGARPTPLRQTPLLRETAFGKWEGLDYAAIAQRFPDEWSAWVADPVAHSAPGGESLAHLRDRLDRFYRSVAEGEPGPGAARDWFTYRAAGPSAETAPPRTLLVVSHGGPVRVLLTRLLDVPVERYWRFSARPASLSILDVYPEGAIAEVIGETAYLD